MVLEDFDLHCCCTCKLSPYPEYQCCQVHQIQHLQQTKNRSFVAMHETVLRYWLTVAHEKQAQAYWIRIILRYQSLSVVVGLMSDITGRRNLGYRIEDDNDNWFQSSWLRLSNAIFLGARALRQQIKKYTCTTEVCIDFSHCM